MARTYSHTPVLSKIVIGENTYYLKDGDARAILDAINADVYASLQLELGTVAGNDSKLVTAANIKAYVDQIAELGFDVVKVAASVVASADAEKYAEYHNKIVLVEDAASVTGNCIEYVIVRSGEEGAYTYAWERIGTTEVDLNDYLTAVTYNASTHTLSETKGGVSTPVHVFGDLADADTASASYTPAGTIGSITVIDNVGSQAAFTQGEDTFTQGADSFVQGVDTFTANVPTALDLTKFNGGSKAADTFNAGSLPSKAADTFNAGTLPSKAADTYVAPSYVVDGANETLTLNPGSFTEGAFSAGTLPTYSEGAFSAGTLPTFTEGAFTAASLAEGFYAPGSAATYSQGTDTFTQGSDSFVQGDDSFTANNVPTTKSVTPTFSGTAATITVNPDAE